MNEQLNILINKYRGVMKLLMDGEVMNLNQREPLHLDPGVDKNGNNYWYDATKQKWEPGMSEIFNIYY